MNKKTVIYIHGKGGSSGEAEHYKKLFPTCEVIGFDYLSQTPWETMEEFSDFFNAISRDCTSMILIANSIGAFFAMNTVSEKKIEKAYFISPIVNMEELILNMIQWAGVTEADLKEQGVIETAFGEALSWKYLSWVRNHPIEWNVPTSILYGSADHLQSIDTIKAFSDGNGANLTVMENGEHWFHTEEQMKFLDSWFARQIVIL